MSTTAGEITESRIDEVSLVLQGADQDSELVVLTKSDEEVAEDEEGEEVIPIEQEIKADCDKSHCEDESAVMQKAYTDLLSVHPSKWTEEIKKGMTDAVLSIFEEDAVEVQKSSDQIELIEQAISKNQESFVALMQKFDEIVSVLQKSVVETPVVPLTDDEILAKASEIEAARKQAEKPDVVQKSIDPRLLANVDALRSSVEKLNRIVSHEMGGSANH